MQIAEGISQYENHILKVGQKGHTAAAKAEGATSKETAQLQKGTVFEGVAVRAKDGYVTLSLSNGQSVHARLAAGVNVKLGEPVLFEVQSNQEHQITIKQVNLNGGYSPALQKALAAAGLPLTERNLKMVDLMMKNQLPVGRESLQAMARIVQSYPQADLETLVQMRRLEIPVTEMSLQQFESYKNGEHALLERFSQIMEQLPRLLEQGGSVKQLLALQNGILGAMELLSESGNGSLAGAEGAFAGQSNGLLPEGSSEAGNVPGDVHGGLSASGSANGRPQAGENVNGFGQLGAQALGLHFTEGDLLSLKQQLLAIPGMEENRSLFSGGELNRSLSAGEMLLAIWQHLGSWQGAEAAAVKKLFEGREYKGLLRQAMAEQWLLSPEQAGEKENIDGLYERLNRQTARLEQFLQTAGLKTEALGREVSNVRGNLELMQQINQLFNYVQIPLKLSRQNAHSDLYVYTNKKKLQDPEGELSALLHLELDNLGTTDVQIKMLGTKVTTNFYLADDSSLKLVEQHLPDLTKRLESKGYQCSVHVEKQEEAEQRRDVVAEFLEREAPVGALQRYSFDVMA